MESLQSQDGHSFIRAVAQYIRQHEKSLANSLQLTTQGRKLTQGGSAPTSNSIGAANQGSTSTLAAAFSFAGLNFKSHSVKSAQLTLTSHHLFYLLTRITEELDVDVGPMHVRVHSIHSDLSPSNYVSFLQNHKTQKGRSDADSLHSVSSVRSVMSGMSSLWASMGLSTASSKSEKARLALGNDMKYIYGAFTKLPALRLTPDHHTPLIKDYEQFPFDTAVPLFAFKNLQQLEIVDLDFRNFHGWDRLADQLRLLTIKRGKIDDPIDLLEYVVLDDTEGRRRRSNRSQGAPSTPSWSMPSTPRADYAQSHSDPGSPERLSPGTSPRVRDHTILQAVETAPMRQKVRSHTFIEGTSPKRPTTIRPNTSYRYARSYSKAKRTGSGSSSDNLTTPARSELTDPNVLPASKWQRLVYLSLADNGLTTLPARSIKPLASSLRSFNLSSNLFTEIPDSLARLSRLASLDLSNCMIDSLQSLVAYALPAITTLKLKSNRLQSLAGVEKLGKLENLLLQDNMLSDPDEAARLAQIASFKRLWIKHNPMTKKFPDYRIRIINHFRRVPGFTEDVVIDDQPATYSERKHLIDRVVEREHPALAEQGLAEVKTIVIQESQRSAPVLEASNRLSMVTLQREPSTASTRKKKGPRRRIVDLADNDSTSRQDSAFSLIHADTIITPIKPAPDQRQGIPFVSDKLAAPMLSISPSLTPDDTVVTLTNNSPASDNYRRNVEELRMKFGNTWLSALGEQTTHWQSDKDLSTLSSTHSSPPKLHHYHSNPPIVGLDTSLS